MKKTKRITKRYCLQCDKSFRSTGNRRCDACHQKEISVGGRFAKLSVEVQETDLFSLGGSLIQEG